MTTAKDGLYGGRVPRQIGVLASHGQRPGAVVPPWIYRAVAYESGDPFRQPVWVCPHNHNNVQDAQLCGSDWAQQRGAREARA
jgi:hypothetical protein